MLTPHPEATVFKNALTGIATSIPQVMAVRFGSHAYPVTPEIRWRHRFTILTGLTTVLLLGWGAFVTSINAGLAVPDWPSSFNSYDPFNPWPEWWKLTPVLAEHGHRLLGALVGCFTLVLAVWTWVKDPRRWMGWLSIGILVLVSLQGVLGGLRVVLLSLDLAVVHACVAQIFFGLIIGIALFTSEAWLTADVGRVSTGRAPRLLRTSLIAVGVIYVQIILGALLRHPGTGIDPLLAVLHITGAVITTAVVVVLFARVRADFRGSRIAYPAARVLVALLVIQFSLGVTAYLVTIDETGMLEPSNVQVVVNTAHMLVGALLMGTATAILFDALRLPAAPKSGETRARAKSTDSVILEHRSL